MQPFILLAWRNLITHRALSLVSLLAVMVGVMMAVANDVLLRSIKQGILQTDEIRQIMSGMLKMMDPMFIFISLILLLASGFLILNTFNMAITRQRQQIGSWRTLGMTRRQVRYIFVIEAGLIGVCGATLGLALGWPFALAMVAVVKQIVGSLLAFADVRLRLSALVWIWLSAVGITLFSVWWPVRMAARITPLDALRQPEAQGQGALQPRQGWLALTFAAALLLAALVTRPSRWFYDPWDIVLTILLVLAWSVALVWLIPFVVHGLAQTILRRSTHSTLRLMVENIQRARARVRMTILSFMLAITVTVGLTGFLQFYITYGISGTLQSAIEQDSLFVTRLNISGGWGAIIADNLDSVLLSDAESAAIVATVGDRAAYAPIYFANIPELSFFGDSFFTYMIPAELLRTLGDNLFTFVEGDWENASAIMRAGCGTLVAPLIANRHQVGIGDTLMLTDRYGQPTPCKVAGIGAGIANTSIINDVLAESFIDGQAVMIFITPRLGENSAALAENLLALQSSYPSLVVISVKTYAGVMNESLRFATIVFNMMTLMVLLVASLAVINTTLISIQERRREIGLLRAVGATQRQIYRILLGETALMGVVGGALGGIGGLGVVILIASSYGVNSFATMQQFSYAAVLAQSLAPAIGIALFGLAAAPLVAMASASLPARTILREQPIETLALR